MRSPDLWSTIVAALIGAAILFGFARTKKAAIMGAVLGAGVQVGVRLTGVS